MASTRRHLTAAGAAVLIALPLAACNGDDPKPTPTPTSESGTGTPTTSSTPTPSPTGPDQIAYAEAERVYRAFVPNFAKANKTFDAKHLDRKLITPALYTFLVKDFARFAQPKSEGITVRFTQEIKTVSPAKYVPGKEVGIRVCAVTNGRFINKAGDDITQTSADPNSPKSPINTTARQETIQVLSTDGGKSWKLNDFTQTESEGTPC